MKTKKYHLRLFFVLLIGITALFLNDRIWKYEYANFLTGKLSDFLGLLTLPLFIGLLFPKSKKYISLAVGLLFIFWKSPFATPIIDAWNEISAFPLSRTIDYTDLFALLVLPFVHQFLLKLEIAAFQKSMKFSFNPLFLYGTIAFACLVFCSTSVPETAYPKGDIFVEETYKLQLSKAEYLDFLNEKGLKISVDSMRYYRQWGVKVGREYYQIEQLIVSQTYSNDTLTEVNFEIYERKEGIELNIINLTLKNKNWSLQDWEVLKSKSKEYQEILKQELLPKSGS